MDTLTELRALAFASRLKRLSERLYKDVSQLYHRLGVGFEPRWFSILYTLNRRTTMTVTGLAQALGYTHTAVNQLSSEMIREGWLSSSKGKRDERQRWLAITPEGKRLVDVLTPVWNEIRTVTQGLVDASGCDLIAAIGTIEQQLDQQSVTERVWARLRRRPPGDVRIVPYRPAYKKYFASLNREWLMEYFTVEKEDEKVLSDPNAKIVKPGGAVFFAMLDGAAVGTAALIRHTDGVLELAKMAVTAKVQGRGIGKLLARAVIDRARELGAGVLYLETNAKLKAANRLYAGLGFRRILKGPFRASRYRRPTYTMRLDLSEPGGAGK